MSDTCLQVRLSLRHYPGRVAAELSTAHVDQPRAGTAELKAKAEVSRTLLRRFLRHLASNSNGFAVCANEARLDGSDGSEERGAPLLRDPRDPLAPRTAHY
eukprot:62355-Prymnesium_polylepis.2